MWLEMGVYMVGGTAWYFSGQDLNAQDWDLTVTGGDLHTKFFTGEAITLDNNTFIFNQMWHPLSYAGIYLTARSNDMSPWMSFLYAFYASLFWEYVGELREKVSINDQIVSSLTAMAWGEVAYNWGEYFNSPESKGRLGRKILTSLFGVPRLFHRWIDETEPTPSSVPRYHFDPKLTLSGIARDFEEEETLQPVGVFGLETTMAVMPEYGRPGRESTVFSDGNFTDLIFEFGVGSDDDVEVDIDANAIVTGRYVRRIDENGEGFDLVFGGARGYRLLSRNGDRMTERIGLVHILGPATRLRVFGPGRLRLEADLDVYFDFSAIRSFAYETFARKYGDEVVATVRTELQKHAYYFGVGFTVAPRLRARLGRWALELGTNVSRVHSLQGLDRFQEEVTRTVILDDLFWDSQVELIAPTPIDAIDLRLDLSSVVRVSRLDELRADVRFRELGLGLVGHF